jgi:beta-galactosidase
VALVTVELVDSEGRLVPNADLNVSFTVSGPGVVLGTTNGDPACHVPATSSRCPTFHGLLRAIVRSSALGAAGVVTVHVEGEGLGSTQVLLRAVWCEASRESAVSVGVVSAHSLPTLACEK